MTELIARLAEGCVSRTILGGHHRRLDRQIPQREVKAVLGQDLYYSMDHAIALGRDLSALRNAMPELKRAVPEGWLTAMKAADAASSGIEMISVLYLAVKPFLVEPYRALLALRGLDPAGEGASIVSFARSFRRSSPSPKTRAGRIFPILGPWCGNNSAACSYPGSMRSTMLFPGVQT